MCRVVNKIPFLVCVVVLTPSVFLYPADAIIRTAPFSMLYPRAFVQSTFIRVKGNGSGGSLLGVVYEVLVVTAVCDTSLPACGQAA